MLPELHAGKCLTRAYGHEGRQLGLEKKRGAQRQLRGGGLQAGEGQGAWLPLLRCFLAGTDSKQRTLLRRVWGPQMTPQPIKTGFGYHLIVVEDRKA